MYPPPPPSNVWAAHSDSPKEDSAGRGKDNFTVTLGKPDKPGLSQAITANISPGHDATRTAPHSYGLPPGTFNPSLSMKKTADKLQ